ncbi:hypothetical protein HK102_004424 [Quaeritorhiza haematococci]|nr:hypothetical protein HK102_004424 [Quaeritorhiza haematococci]
MTAPIIPILTKPPDKPVYGKSVVEAKKKGEEETKEKKNPSESVKKDEKEEKEEKGNAGNWKRKLKGLLHVLVMSWQATKAIDPERAVWIWSWNVNGVERFIRELAKKCGVDLKGEVKPSVFFEEILNATGCACGVHSRSETDKEVSDIAT